MFSFLCLLLLCRRVALLCVISLLLFFLLYCMKEHRWLNRGTCLQYHASRWIFLVKLKQHYVLLMSLVQRYEAHFRIYFKLIVIFQTIFVKYIKYIKIYMRQNFISQTILNILFFFFCFILCPVWYYQIHLSNKFWCLLFVIFCWCIC